MNNLAKIETCARDLLAEIQRLRGYALAADEIPMDDLEHLFAATGDTKRAIANLLEIIRGAAPVKLAAE